MPINLEAARRKIESEMVDTVRVVRKTSSINGAFNPADGTYTLAVPTTIYEGVGIVSSYGQEPRSKAEGEGETKEATYTIRIPVSADDVYENDVVIVLSSGRDAAMVGEEFLVVGVVYSTFAVSRNLVAENRSKRLDP